MGGRAVSVGARDGRSRLLEISPADLQRSVTLDLRVLTPIISTRPMGVQTSERLRTRSGRVLRPLTQTGPGHPRAPHAGRVAGLEFWPGDRFPRRSARPGLRSSRHARDRPGRRRRPRRRIRLRRPPEPVGSRGVGAARRTDRRRRRRRSARRTRDRDSGCGRHPRGPAGLLRQSPRPGRRRRPELVGGRLPRGAARHDVARPARPRAQDDGLRGHRPLLRRRRDRHGRRVDRRADGR